MAKHADSTQGRLVQTFKQLDEDGGGMTWGELVSIVESLDPEWTEQRLLAVFAAAGVSLEGAVDVEKLLVWLFQDAAPSGDPADRPEPAAPLAAHFLSEGYATGAAMEVAGTGYVLGQTAAAVPVYIHEASGLQVWQEGIDLRPEGVGESKVLFCYVDDETFHAVAQ
eukprot:CAMPEP_0168457638 /NCGR_PEP_ID=MMETSP0228-20121227/51951_1 /TAXON_ID=133427 /ORGANISM="Protoceratium reticulatum, Strain CCCM 535 (=CCMP 1889)" /LENGTH=166 /DNA_ID=CAMNT_0008472685 /DNA_START=42 /DNA_END=539 /DNA_ORIENTATION=+